MHDKTRDAIRKALFEAFFVVLAAALALAANEWRQQRADRQQASSALAGVVEELKSNRSAVSDSFEYHTGLIEMLRALAPGAPAPGPRQFPRGFVSPAQVFRTAWDAATETGALSHMEYSTVLALSQLYARQERYEGQAKVAGEIIYRELFHAGMSGVLDNYVNLATIINTFMFREKQLLEFYDQTLESLGEPPPVAASAPAEPAGSPG